MPETSRDCVVILLDETSFTVPVKVGMYYNSISLSILVNDLIVH